jgi:hypothetical protein
MTRQQGLLTEEDLKQWTGYGTQGGVLRFLNKNRIPYTTGKDGRVVTTLSAINQSLVKGSQEEHQDIDFL